MYGLGEHYWLIRGLCGFRGDQNLLDIGCGCGKTALALMNTIRPPGSYTGFDIQPVLVEFVDRLFKQQRISSHFHVDCFPIVGNKYYSGTRQGVSAEAFEFPYADERFDMAVSFSVFTHLRNRAMVNYVNNLGRVMRRGSKLLLSFYLLDNSPEGNRGGDPWRPSQRREALMRSPRSADSADGDVLRVLKPEMPEFLVAYRLDHLLETFEKYGFSLSREPMFGSWSGRSDFFGHQDYLVFERK
jgi:SAM-dependent methyltransferase